MLARNQFNMLTLDHYCPEAPSFQQNLERCPWLGLAHPPSFTARTALLR